MDMRSVGMFEKSEGDVRSGKGRRCQPDARAERTENMLSTCQTRDIVHDHANESQSASDWPRVSKRHVDGSGVYRGGERGSMAAGHGVYLVGVGPVGDVGVGKYFQHLD